MFVKKCRKALVNKTVAGARFYPSDRKWLEGKKVIFIDGEKQERRIFIVADGAELIVEFNILYM